MRQRQLNAHHNQLPVPPGLTAVLHFPTSFVVSCGHVTQFWPMARGCQKHTILDLVCKNLPHVMVGPRLPR